MVLYTGWDGTNVTAGSLMLLPSKDTILLKLHSGKKSEITTVLKEQERKKFCIKGAPLEHFLPMILYTCQWWLVYHWQGISLHCQKKVQEIVEKGCKNWSNINEEVFCSKWEFLYLLNEMLTTLVTVPNSMPPSSEWWQS